MFLFFLCLSLLILRDNLILACSDYLKFVTIGPVCRWVHAWRLFGLIWILDSKLVIGLEIGHWTKKWSLDLKWSLMQNWSLDAKLVSGHKIDQWTRNWSLDTKLISNLKLVTGHETSHWMQNWLVDVKFVCGCEIDQSTRIL